jgi:hypothetical protein
LHVAVETLSIVGGLPLLLVAPDAPRRGLPDRGRRRVAVPVGIVAAVARVGAAPLFAERVTRAAGVGERTP